MTTPAKAKRPASLEVGPFRYNIDWTVEGWSEAINGTHTGLDPDRSRYYGFTDHINCDIWVNPHAAAPFQREALLHELIHACQFVAGLPNSTPVGEDFISRVSPILLDTLRRNRGLVEYLMDKTV